MSLHKSFKRNGIDTKRSVIKRIEKIKWLRENGKWNEGDRVLGLPKIKIIRLKALKKDKKEKVETKETEKK